MSDSGSVFIEVTALPRSDRQISPVHRTWERLESSRRIVEEAIAEGVSLALGAAIGSNDTDNWRLSELEVCFGIKVTADAGVIVSSVGGEASLEVTVRASRK